MPKHGIYTNKQPLNKKRFVVYIPTGGWSFTDVEGVENAGTGDTEFTEIPAGPITLTWATLPGHDAPIPNPQTKQLAPDEMVTFRQIYVPSNDPDARLEARLLRYLLGLDEDSEGLDLNTDGEIGVADLVTNSSPDSESPGP